MAESIATLRYTAKQDLREILNDEKVYALNNGIQTLLIHGKDDARDMKDAAIYNCNII